MAAREQSYFSMFLCFLFGILLIVPSFGIAKGGSSSRSRHSQGSSVSRSHRSTGSHDTAARSSGHSPTRSTPRTRTRTSAGAHYSGSKASSHVSTRTAGSIHSSHSNRAAAGIARDRHGRIARSATAKRDFMKANPCPSTGRSSGSCPGYVVDHVTPLKRGGADSPGNMQWQTVAVAKVEDKVE